MLVPRAPSLLQEKDSNLRPCGYEPRELPLLYPAILNVIYDNFFKLPNIFYLSPLVVLVGLPYLNKFVEMRGIEPLSYKELIIPACHTFRIKFNLINFPK